LLTPNLLAFALHTAAWLPALAWRAAAAACEAAAANPFGDVRPNSTGDRYIGLATQLIGPGKVCRTENTRIHARHENGVVGVKIYQSAC